MQINESILMQTNVSQFLIHLQHGNKSQERCMTSQHGQGYFFLLKWRNLSEHLRAVCTKTDTTYLPPRLSSLNKQMIWHEQLCTKYWKYFSFKTMCHKTWNAKHATAASFTSSASVKTLTWKYTNVFTKSICMHKIFVPVRYCTRYPHSSVLPFHRWDVIFYLLHYWRHWMHSLY